MNLEFVYDIEEKAPARSFSTLFSLASLGQGFVGRGVVKPACLETALPQDHISVAVHLELPKLLEHRSILWDAKLLELQPYLSLISNHAHVCFHIHVYVYTSHTENGFILENHFGAG